MKIKETFFCEYSEIWPKFKVTNIHGKILPTMFLSYHTVFARKLCNCT